MANKPTKDQIKKCQEVKEPCKTGGLCCVKKQKKYEACCTKACRCMTEDEDKEIKKGFPTMSKSGKSKYNHKSDPDYIEKVLEAQYKSTKNHDDCKYTRAECQKKSKCFFISKKNADKQGDNQEEGCCPGQTGHHIIPGSIFCPGASRLPATLDKLGLSEKIAMIAAGGETYSQKFHNDAPTICVAGGSHSIGSHGWMHSATKLEIKKLVDSNQVFNLENVIDACTKAHDHVYKESDCDKECMKQTLREEYNGMAPRYKKDGSSAKKASQKNKLQNLYNKIKDKGVKISNELVKHLGG